MRESVRAWARRGLLAGAVGACSSLVACPGGPLAAPAKADPPQVVRFVGRFDATEPDRPRFGWSGSAVATRFAAKSLHVRLKETGYDALEVVLDGVPAAVLSVNPSREDYEVAAGLDGGPHDLVLVKRTEARMGELQFLGFEPATALLPPARPAPSRRIELIGDSITAGYGAEGVGPSCTGNLADLENEYLSYGALTARALGADHTTIAWSGRTAAEMVDLYDRTLPTRPTSRWDFARWTPDAVVINLGTNDFNRGDPGQPAFEKPYLALLQKVRARYPRAPIVCLLGPMLTDSYPQGAHNLTRAREYLTQIVAKVRAAGDARVSFLELATQDFANGLGCDYHPSLKTHKMMADPLTATLRALLRW